MYINEDLTSLSPEQLSMISEAEEKLSDVCGHDVVLVAYDGE